MIEKIGGEILKHRFVQAGMNLEGSANQRLSRIMKSQIQIAKDNSMAERVDSLVLARKPFAIPANTAKAEEIIPENSINYLA